MVVNGNSSWRIQFLRRISIGSMPTSLASSSIIRSMAYVAPGRPAPREAPAGAAVGIRRRLGGEHAMAREGVRLHLVDRVEHESAEQRNAGRHQLQVGTH